MYITPLKKSIKKTIFLVRVAQRYCFYLFRSSHWRCSIKKKPVPKNCAIFIGKHLRWSLFLIKFFNKLYQKETPTQVLSSEYCEVFKNTNFEEHLPATAFIYWKNRRWLPILKNWKMLAETCFTFHHNLCFAIPTSVENIPNSHQNS